MSFSYGYHFCSNSKLNCLRGVIDPPPDKDRQLLALKELKQTSVDIEKMVKEFEKKTGLKA